MTIRRFTAAFFLIFLLAAALPAVGQDQLTHIIQPGETLFRISQDYGISVEAIAAVNNIANTWAIYSGQTLIIPVSEDAVAAMIEPVDLSPADPNLIEVAPEADVASEDFAADSSGAEVAEEAAPVEQEIHVVAWGENLATIARRYNMSMERLAQLNQITNPDLIYSGQELIIVPGDGTAASDGPGSYLGSVYSSVTHVVQPGENLVTIARRYNISWLQIAQANSISDGDMIMPGIELIIPGGETLPGAEYSFVTAPAAPAARVGVGREIIVDLSEQRMYAYEDSELVRSVIVSTGLPATPTVQGAFTIQRRYVAQTMTGPGYYLPDVPFVQYFYAGYAFHGTYWHENFGQPMSHGCVNLPTPESEWLYNWADVGTNVYVQV